MSEGMNRRMCDRVMRQDVLDVRTRDIRAHSSPTEHSHAALQRFGVVTRAYQRDSSSKHPSSFVAPPTSETNM